MKQLNMKLFTGHVKKKQKQKTQFLKKFVLFFMKFILLSTLSF